MPFNSDTYARNQAKRQAWEHLADARRRRENGEPQWHVESAVKLARSCMRRYLSWCRIAKIDGKA